MLIKIDRDRCKKCGLCIKYCPQNVFVEGPDGEPVVARESDCTYCQLCTTLCPDFAITVKGE